MNRKTRLVSLFPLILLLCSCYFTPLSKRINYFIPGLFTGYNDYDNTQSCFLNITEITKDSFKSSNGKNVIHDLVADKFYSLEFYVIDKDANKYTFDFINFKDAFNGATGTLIAYKDENGTWLKPFTTGREGWADVGDYCSVHITNVEPEIYTYLYLKEN